MTNRNWIIFITVVIVLFGGLVYLSNRNKIDVSNVDGSKVQAKTEASGNIADRQFGSSDKKVVLVEYGDFQCPGCGTAYEPIKTVTEKYKDQLTFVFRNFPLTNAHANARAAASAAEVAGLMGQYWEMHDKLYQSQSDWEEASTSDRTQIFVNYAQEIGLDANKFEAMLSDKSDAVNQKINFDIALGRKQGVDGTPTFFLNGELVNQKFKDGKLVDSNDPDGSQVWADADNFERLIIRPALEKAGYKLPPLETTAK